MKITVNIQGTQDNDRLQKATEQFLKKALKQKGEQNEKSENQKKAQKT